MKNILLSGGVVAVLILLGLIIWTLFVRAPEEIAEPLPGTQFPVATTAPKPATTGDTLTIGNAQGGTFQVKNFLIDGETVADPVNTGSYLLGPHFPLDGLSSSTPSFTITYIESSQFFNIGLFKEPISESRFEAEQYIRDHLGITKEQMCALNYVVSVPNFVSPLFAGDSLGFSFCPGAIEI